MATQTDVTTALKKGNGHTDLISLIRQSQSELAKALPKHMNAERIARIALTCIRTNPELLKCTPESFLGALFTSAQLGIEPVAGRGYLLPFNNNRKTSDGWKTYKEVQFVLGYKGVIELFYRHSKAIKIDWGVVKENDDFEYELGTNAYLRHKPNSKQRGETVGYWAMAELQGGGKPFHYITKEDAIQHGLKHSKAVDQKAGEFYKTSPWVTDTDSMCLKTVLVQLAKLLPLSVELQRAIDADETSRDFRKEFAASTDNVLDIPETTEWTEAEVTQEEKQSPKPKAKKESTPEAALIAIGKAKELDAMAGISKKAAGLKDSGDWPQPEYTDVEKKIKEWYVKQIAKKNTLIELEQYSLKAQNLLNAGALPDVDYNYITEMINYRITALDEKGGRNEAK